MNKKKVPGILFIILLGVSSAIAEAPNSFRSITDIFIYLQKNTQSDEFFTLKHDLNKDKRKDYLIGLNCKIAKPCLFHLFVSSDKKFFAQGSILLQENSFEILDRTHHGLTDILYYQDKDDRKGTLVRYQFDGKQYETKNSFTGNYRLKTILDTQNE